MRNHQLSLVCVTAGDLSNKNHGRQRAHTTALIICRCCRCTPDLQPPHPASPLPPLSLPRCARSTSTPTPPLYCTACPRRRQGTPASHRPTWARYVWAVWGNVAALRLDNKVLSRSPAFQTAPTPPPHVSPCPPAACCQDWCICICDEKEACPQQFAHTTPHFSPACCQDWCIRIGDEEELVVCHILQTAEFCKETVEGAAAAVRKEIKQQLKEKVGRVCVWGGMAGLGVGLGVGRALWQARAPVATN